MDIPMDAAIECSDGLGGRSKAVILNPINKEVTHVVVHEPGILGFERLVSVDLINKSTHDSITLQCTKAELSAMPPFVTTSYIPATSGLMVGGMGLMFWPYVQAQPASGVDHENIDPDELAIHRGSHVNATDGHVGEVEEFVINPTNNWITHVILREGHFWNRQEITIPVVQIDHINNDTVYLKLNKHQIEELPALSVQH